MRIICALTSAALVVVLVLASGPAAVMGRPAPDEKQLSTLPQDVVAAWKKAGATEGWLQVTDYGRHYFVYKAHARAENLPGFLFSDRRPSFADLPAPDVPFGIHLSRTGVRAADLKALAGLKNLRQLSLEGERQLTDEALKELARFEHLEVLSIYSTIEAPKFTTAGLKELGSAKSLKELYIDGGIFTGTGEVRPDVGAEFAEFKNLRLLSLINVELSDAGFRELGTLSDMRTVFLTYTRVTDARLTELGKLKQLRTLRVSGDERHLDKVTADGVKRLAALTELRELVLAGVPVTDEGAKHLAGLKNLRELDLSRSHLTGAGMAHLAGLTELRSLRLDHSHISDAGMKHLAGLKNLESLNLHLTEISDEGLAHLAGLNNLKSLSLCNTAVSNAGIKHLAGLAKLERLNLSENALTVAVLKHLVGLKKLRSVYLWDTKTYGTPERNAALNEIRKAMPDCTFDTSPPL